MEVVDDASRRLRIERDEHEARSQSVEPVDGIDFWEAKLFAHEHLGAGVLGVSTGWMNGYAAGLVDDDELAGWILVDDLDRVGRYRLKDKRNCSVRSAFSTAWMCAVQRTAEMGR